MRLALDHHYSPAIAVALRARGHDVVAAVECGWQALEDTELLDACFRDARALLTNDVPDFTVIVRERAAAGDGHRGVVFTADSAFPRGKAGVGRLVRALDALLEAHPDERALVDSIHWL